MYALWIQPFAVWLGIVPFGSGGCIQTVGGGALVEIHGPCHALIVS